MEGWTRARENRRSFLIGLCRVLGAGCTHEGAAQKQQTSPPIINRRINSNKRLCYIQPRTFLTYCNPLLSILLFLLSEKIADVNIHSLCRYYCCQTHALHHYRLVLATRCSLSESMVRVASCAPRPAHSHTHTAGDRSSIK